MDEIGRKTILVVDDYPEERKIFSTYLGFVGYDVETAEDGAECLRKARAKPPALILLDLRMPVLNGWETIDQLSQDPATHNVPVMALTASHLEAGLLQDAGFCGYLEKPLAPYRVFSEVERCIGSAAGGPPPPRNIRNRTAPPGSG